MFNEGFISKLEVVRGIATTFKHWRRRDGANDVRSTGANPALLGIWDDAGVKVTADPQPVVTVHEDGYLTFSWTPGVALLLGEDYRYEVQYVGDDDLTHVDVVHFDLVRRSMECPVDGGLLLAREPIVTKLLAGLALADPSQFIIASWSHIVSRVRAMGFRPALVTDRHAFTEVCVARALELLFAACTRSPNDLFDRKRQFYADAQIEAWGSIGRVRFEDEVTATVVGEAVALPRFRL